MPAELSQDALQKAARAAHDAVRAPAPANWVGSERREYWTAVARAAIETYRDATTPLEFWCTACHQPLTWLLKEDPPPETACFCGAMVATGRNGAPDAR